MFALLWLLEWDGVTTCTRTVRFYFVLLYGHNRLSEKIFVYKTKVNIFKKKLNSSYVQRGMVWPMKSRSLIYKEEFSSFFLFSSCTHFIAIFFHFYLNIVCRFLWYCTLKLKETMQKTDFQFSFCDIPVNCFKNHSNFYYIFLVT